MPRWTAMRLLTGILYPLRRNRIAVLGARSAPKRHCETSQGLCRDIKGRTLGWLVRWTKVSEPCQRGAHRWWPRRGMTFVLNQAFYVVVILIILFATVSLPPKGRSAPPQVLRGPSGQ